jgi:sulfate adenylyltransferase subunit 2
MSDESTYLLSDLDLLEAEAISIMREVVAELDNPVMLYSVGKDSSVMVQLARKAFAPAPIPFPLLHVDTGYKFAEMIRFRDAFCERIGAELRVHRNEAAIADGTHPDKQGTTGCCALLKTRALLDALAAGRYDGAFGGARREEERSRAKERVFSFRDRYGQWEPRQQRPELWQLYNARKNPEESFRIFPLSNWTELDIWRYIEREQIPIVPMYFAAPRPMLVRQGTTGEQLIPLSEDASSALQRQAETIWSRFRTLGCYPCTGAVRSRATTIAEIIEELEQSRRSERVTRIIDHDQDGSMELKKREGYF